MRALRVVAAVAAVALSATCGAVSVRLAAVSWPESICAASSGPSIRVPTISDDGLIRVDPSPLPPLSDAASAYASYLSATGGPSREQAPQLQVRFGLLTDGEQSSASAGPLAFVPHARRVPTWVVSVCNAPFPPPRDSPISPTPGFPVPDTRDGQLIVAIDPSNGHAVAGAYTTAKVMIGQGQDFIIQPPPDQTSYLSVSWRLAAVADAGRKVLLQYQPVGCMALDHVVINQDDAGPPTAIVVLSGPPHHQGHCPADAAPFAEAVLKAPTTAPLRPGPTGSLRFEKVSL